MELDRAIGKEKMAADDTLGYYPKPKVTGLFDYTNVESIVKSITPNPFTHTTKVSLSVPSADYSAVIFNNFGQKVKTLSDSQKSSGFVDLIWNATDEKNVKVAPGMYHLQINCNGQSYQDKIILID